MRHEQLAKLPIPPDLRLFEKRRISLSIVLEAKYLLLVWKQARRVTRRRERFTHLSNPPPPSQPSSTPLASFFCASILLCFRDPRQQGAGSQSVLRMIWLLSLLSIFTFVQAHGYVEWLILDDKNVTSYLPYFDPWQKPPKQRITRAFVNNGL